MGGWLDVLGVGLKAEAATHLISSLSAVFSLFTCCTEQGHYTQRAC